MTNHVHMVMKPGANSSLSNIMKTINQAFSLHRKRTYGFRGQLWQGRFKSTIIKDESYLLTCGIYIELNPVRASMVSEPDQYEGSSYKAYAYGKPDDLVTPSPAYASIGLTDEERRRTYRVLTKMWKNKDA